MNRFLTDILPKALITAQDKRRSLEHEKMGVAFKLDADEEFRDHDCNCDRCESKDYEPLSRLQVEELEAQFAELDQEITGLDSDIKRMTEYKAFMERNSYAKTN